MAVKSGAVPARRGARARPRAAAGTVGQSRLFPYALATPAVVAVGLVLGLPILFNLYLGFTDTSAFTGLDRRSWIGLENYTSILSSAQYRDAFVTTLAWTAANLVLQVSLGMLFALVLHAAPLRVAKVMQPIWLLPWFLPSVSIFYVWKMLFDPSFGGLHQLAGAVGLAPENGVLGDPGLAMWGVVMAGAWKGFPFYMAVFYAGLQAVPQELYDAARVDGASRGRVFRHIELPEIRTITATAGVLGFIWTFNWFTPIFVMTAGGPGDSTLTLPVYVYEQAIRQFYLGRGAAAANGLLLIMGFAFLLIIYAQRRARRRATALTLAAAE